MPTELTHSRTRWVLLVVAVLALASLACLGGLAAPTATPLPPPTPIPPTPVPPTAVPPTAAPSTGGINLVIDNQSAVTVCYVFIAPVAQTDWGNDQLGSENVVVAGDAFTITGVPAGTYDLKTEDCDRNVISWNYGVQLDAGAGDVTLTVSGSADQLVVENASSLDVCRVFISPPSEENWGRAQVDTDNPIPAGTSRSIAVVAGTWNLRAEPCGGGDAIERLGENISTGTTTWTLSDE